MASLGQRQQHFAVQRAAGAEQAGARPRLAPAMLAARASQAAHPARAPDCAAQRAAARRTCTQEPAHVPGVRRAWQRVKLAGREAASLVETWGSEYNGATDRAHPQPLHPAAAPPATRIRGRRAHVRDARQSGRQAIWQSGRQGIAVGHHRRSVRPLHSVHRRDDAADGGARRRALHLQSSRRRQ